MTTLHHKTTRAVIWSALDVFMRQGLQFIVLIVLARILAPEDYGAIAMLGLFVGVAGIFIDSGFSSALIQRQNTTHVEESTVFFFNLLMGMVVAVLLCVAAPWIATFFKQPVLRYLTYVMALNLLVNAFGSIHTTLLNKDLNFKTIAKVGMVASLLSGALAIILAIQGFGVWSLALQTLAASVITVLLLWVWHPWRPVWAFSFTSLGSFFRFGGYEMAANLTDVFSTNLYLILIGKMFSVREVGFYDRAHKTQQLPVMLMMGIINRVAYSAFSTAAKDQGKLIWGFRKAQAMSMFVNTPILIGVGMLAEPLVSTFFGVQWLSCVPILQVLALAGLLWPLHLLNLSVLKAQGRSDLFFWITMFKKVFTISLTVIASFYGVMAIAWSQVLISVVAYFVNTHYTKEFLGYGAVKQLRDLSINFMAVIPMAVSIYLISNMLQLSQPIKLVVASITGGGIYLLTCRLVCTELMYEFFRLIGVRQPAG